MYLGHRLSSRYIFVLGMMLVVLVADTARTEDASPSNLGRLRLMFPVSFALSKNEVDKIHVDVGSGFSADYLLLRFRNLNFGPGLSLFGTVPASPGNRTVAIKPYTALSELRMIGAIDLTHNERGFTPHVAIGAQLGSLMIAKAVQKTRRLDAELLFGGVITTGITYWLDAVGFGLLYGLCASTMALRHKIEISLQFAVRNS